MVNIRILKALSCFLIFAMLVVLVLGVVFYKPPLSTITSSELDSIQGVGEVRLSQIQAYISQNKNAKVEDLRIIKGVEDMIIEQLEKRFR